MIFVGAGLVLVGAGLVPAQNGASTRHCPYEMPQIFCLGTYIDLQGLQDLVGKLLTYLCQAVRVW